jgi:hypothetical protein
MYRERVLELEEELDVVLQQVRGYLCVYPANSDVIVRAWQLNALKERREQPTILDRLVEEVTLQVSARQLQ